MKENPFLSEIQKNEIEKIVEEIRKVFPDIELPNYERNISTLNIVMATSETDNNLKELTSYYDGVKNQIIIDDTRTDDPDFKYDLIISVLHMISSRYDYENKVLYDGYSVNGQGKVLNDVLLHSIANSIFVKYIVEED